MSYLAWPMPPFFITLQPYWSLCSSHIPRLILAPDHCPVPLWQSIFLLLLVWAFTPHHHEAKLRASLFWCCLWLSHLLCTPNLALSAPGTSAIGFSLNLLFPCLKFSFLQYLPALSFSSKSCLNCYLFSKVFPGQPLPYTPCRSSLSSFFSRELT